jgi:hypothetical protein
MFVAFIRLFISFVCKIAAWTENAAIAGGEKKIKQIVFFIG